MPTPRRTGCARWPPREAEFRNDVFQEDLSYRNQLIEIFGRPYDGTVGPGKLYPAGYDGPDLALYMYVNVREINKQHRARPSLSFASFNTNGVLNGGDLYTALQRHGRAQHHHAGRGYAVVVLGHLCPDSSGTTPVLARDGYYSVTYTDLTSPRWAWITSPS
jgi:hypothetical protein